MPEFEFRKDFFGTRVLGRNLFHFKAIDSTQTFVRNRLLENKAEPGILALADYQSMGKGTQGRTWFSLPRPQLMFSLLIQTRLPPQKLPIINILAAVVMSDVIRTYEIQSKIKWPNDIYIGDKKTAGILSELVIHADIPYVILGMGVNTDAVISDFPLELQGQVTALSMHSPHIDRFRVLNDFVNDLENILETDSISQIVDRTQQGFKKYWMFKNYIIEIQQDRTIVKGLAEEIDENGALVLKTETGLKKIISGSILMPSLIDKPAKND